MKPWSRQRWLGGLSFGLLALVAELVGRSLTHRLDLGRHVAYPGDSAASYYPLLLICVKAAIALLLARLAWRAVRALLVEREARTRLAAVGARPHRPVPRPCLRLSPRLTVLFFLTTSLLYLVQTDAEAISAGRWPLLAPWVHSSALPVFAVLAVVAALVWGVVASWLSEYERYAEHAAAHARGLARGVASPAQSRPNTGGLAPRRLFGLAFESRPPPARAL